MATKKILAATARIGITLLATAGAIYVGMQLWQHYEVEPWTRDGRLKAYVVQVAPDVTGQVTKVYVHDNQQVKAGEPLFDLDRARFELALRQANAQVTAAEAALAQTGGHGRHAMKNLQFPGADIGIVAATARLAVGPQRNQVDFAFHAR